MEMSLPSNLSSLHEQEELLRTKSVEAVETDPKFRLHFHVAERAMNLLDVFRQYATADEDYKVVQMLSLRMFNAFGAATKLMLSGYYLFSAQVLRDVLETVFLLDLFRTDPQAVTAWRGADRKQRMREFAPIKVRELVD